MIIVFKFELISYFCRYNNQNFESMGNIGIKNRRTSWTERVSRLMNQDGRLIRQNPVIETSL